MKIKEIEDCTKNKKKHRWGPILKCSNLFRDNIYALKCMRCGLLTECTITGKTTKN